MSWPGRVAAAAGRATVRLVPPARRDWAEAVLAEAYEVPAGWPRLAWRASGARLIAREAMVVRSIGALTVTALGFGTTALMLKSAWIRGWLYHGQHLTASAVYGRELYASGNMAFYAVICVIFPIIGLMAGLAGSGYANVTAPESHNDVALSRL
jgi:hypothetical protein